MRIFHKECVSIAQSGQYSVNLIISASKAEVAKAKSFGVRVIRIPAIKNRLARFVVLPIFCLLHSLRTGSRIFHVHDPELLPLALLLSLIGKSVVYDAHEDLRLDILDKYWIAPVFRKPLSLLIGCFENFAASRISHVVCATKSISLNFSKSRTLVLNNYPLPSEYILNPLRSNEKHGFCFVGGITPIRGVQNVCLAFQLLEHPPLFKLAGSISTPELEQNLLSSSNSFLDYFGFVERKQAYEIMYSSLAGFVLYDNLPNHTNAMPNKLFEYMSAGTAIIASDFPLWKDIIANANCGICVNPHDPQQISDAIAFLQNNPQRAVEMGKNGRSAVASSYNWSSEERKLISLYSQL
ncbi:glycosyltransferase [Synechococcus sp. MIT S9509]|uniref:glycosyltransferase n=1 Tax=Synechococcus sp. MIT S9509 TaxID=1801630 RepID=UPI001E3B5010|nr:glycosyltransferase [Synechococcus sp. MIT S9509]